MEKGANGKSYHDELRFQVRFETGWVNCPYPGRARRADDQLGWSGKSHGLYWAVLVLAGPRGAEDKSWPAGPVFGVELGFGSDSKEI
jgi:hypothetical protein